MQLAFPIKLHVATANVFAVQKKIISIWLLDKSYRTKAHDLYIICIFPELSSVLYRYGSAVVTH